MQVSQPLGPTTDTLHVLGNMFIVPIIIKMTYVQVSEIILYCDSCSKIFTFVLISHLERSSSQEIGEVVQQGALKKCLVHPVRRPLQFLVQHLWSESWGRIYKDTYEFVTLRMGFTMTGALDKINFYQYS